MPVVITTVQNPSEVLTVTTPPILLLIAFIPPPSWTTKVGIANAEAAHAATARVANIPLTFFIFTLYFLAQHIPAVNRSTFVTVQVTAAYALHTILLFF